MNNRVECVRCGSRAQMYLCHRCTGHTRRALRDLAGLAHHLAEAAIGQTRLGDIGRHTPYRSRHELDGEATLASQIEPLPECDDLEEARRQREQNALRKLLAAGGVNERASALHADITNMLTSWIRDLCEDRGVEWVGPGRIADMCAWLNLNFTAIAGHPAADEFSAEVDEHLGHIRRLINRPEPPRFIGPCPSPVNHTHDNDCQRQHPHPCGTALRAPRKATTATCPECSTTHDDLDQLGLELLAGVDDWWLNQTDLLFAMAAMGNHIPTRTFREWRRTRRIPELIVSGEPRYRIADARALLEVKPQKATTGAAARKRES